MGVQKFSKLGGARVPTSTPTKDGSTNLIFSPMFLENCMKMRKLEPGERGDMSLAPLGSTTELDPFFKQRPLLFFSA